MRYTPTRLGLSASPSAGACSLLLQHYLQGHHSHALERNGLDPGSPSWTLGSINKLKRGLGSLLSLRVESRRVHGRRLLHHEHREREAKVGSAENNRTAPSCFTVVFSASNGTSQDPPYCSPAMFTPPPVIFTPCNVFSLAKKILKSDSGPLPCKIGVPWVVRVVWCHTGCGVAVHLVQRPLREKRERERERESERKSKKEYKSVLFQDHEGFQLFEVERRERTLITLPNNPRIEWSRTAAPLPRGDVTALFLSFSLPPSLSPLGTVGQPRTISNQPTTTQPQSLNFKTRTTTNSQPQTHNHNRNH